MSTRADAALKEPLRAMSPGIALAAPTIWGPAHPPRGATAREKREEPFMAPPSTKLESQRQTAGHVDRAAPREERRDAHVGHEHEEARLERRGVPRLHLATAKRIGTATSPPISQSMGLSPLGARPPPTTACGLEAEAPLVRQRHARIAHEQVGPPAHAVVVTATFTGNSASPPKKTPSLASWPRAPKRGPSVALPARRHAASAGGPDGRREASRRA